MNEGGMSKYYLDAMDKTIPIDNRRNAKKKVLGEDSNFLSVGREEEIQTLVGVIWHLL